ncbi:Sparc (SPARC) related MOdular Calcium binding protein-like protein [Aphelenchoides bicaudatus]|nr:Sparc (SPARC) related MOdular Calcium binding protein-like protein [Aphelenchoides bicaudatus]
MSSSFFDYLFVFHLFLLHASAKSLNCHRLDCSFQGVDWICGSDNRDYLNLCELERIRCFGVSVHMRAKGKCPGPPEKRQLTEHAQILIKSACTEKEWHRFQRSINKFWRKDYFRKPRPGADISLSIEKRVLHFNFGHIDTDNDELISNTEWKHYRLNKRHPIKGKCARDLIFKCDRNMDRQLDRIEWLQCLYLNPFDFDKQWYHPKAGKDSSKKSQKLSKQPAILTAKPCQQMPKLSGNSSLDRFVYGVDCNNQPAPNSLNPNCTAEKNLRFLQMLFSQFKTEMIFAGQMPSGGMKESRRQAASWKFQHLDKNGDNIIQRPEWRSFRQFIKHWDGVRKCGRSFFRGCDVNLDRQITVDEWHACTVEAYERAAFTPKIDRNPFLYLLRPEN